MIQPVVQLPGAVLSVPASPIEDIDDEVRALARDLLDTMRGSGHSFGVAAPQIGVGLRAFCVDVTGHAKARSCHGEIVLLNPEIIRSTGREVGREGCMSVPDLTGDVIRATELVVRGLAPDGGEVALECDAFEARAIQHELDHLEGILFLDRVMGPDRVFQRRSYR